MEIHDYGSAFDMLSAFAEASDPKVRRVQAQLTTAGYDPGPVDGIMGPHTMKAIAAFQRDNGMAVNGLVSLELLRKLDDVAGEPSLTSATPIAHPGTPTVQSTSQYGPPTNTTTAHPGGGILDGEIGGIPKKAIAGAAALALILFVATA